jgi:uncharacterized repeat protein (TIGR01451 family)
MAPGYMLASERGSVFTFFRTMVCAVLCAAALSAYAVAATPRVALGLSDALVTVSHGKAVAGPVDRPVKSGDVLRYTIVAKNVGSAPAYQLAPIGQIPERMTFLRIISAPTGAAVAYTLDSKTWSAHPTVTVKNKDGKVVTKPAPLELYRAVRWTLTHPLAAKASDSFIYEVRVK